MNAGQGLFLNSPIGRGPLLRARRRTAFLVYLVIAAIGLLPSALGWSPAWRAFGLGLVMPGGGFLYTASPHWMILAILLFAVALAAWLIVGGFIFPFIVWGAAALLAALDSGGTLWPWAQYGTPVIAAAVVARAMIKERKHDKEGVGKAEVLKHHLASVPYCEPTAVAAMGEPLSDRDVAALRFTLDLALQPVESFDGFTTIDQFREAAWRYQLVTINYALAALQTTRLPAFTGYLHEAQRNSILKMTDRRVWKYWRVENFLGNLKFDADPIRRENVMYSGWWALALGAYERATGNLEFSRPGALPLVENARKTFVYDYPSIVDALAENFDETDLCFFPCEPNWVFFDLQPLWHDRDAAV